MNTRTQITTTTEIDGTASVIDIQGMRDYDLWTIEVSSVGRWALSRVGSGTWNDDSQRIENMTADLPEDVYNALDLAIADALEG